MAGQGGMPTVSSVLLALLLCGLLGTLGQDVHAIVGLKNAGSLSSTTPTPQADFSLAYLVLSLMIRFIAGVLAGIALNLENIITVDPSNWKLLLGIAGSGYIGADFIENTGGVFRHHGRGGLLRVLVSGQQRLPAACRPMGHRRDHPPRQRRRRGGGGAAASIFGRHGEPASRIRCGGLVVHAA